MSTAPSDSPAAACGYAAPATAVVATARFYLRPFEESDAEALAAAADDPEVSRQLRSRFPSPYTLADARSRIAYCRSPEGPAAVGLTLGVFTPAGEFVGPMTLEPPAGDPIYAGTRELGYFAGRKFWGRGLMSAAVKEFTRWAFATLPDLLRIEAAVFDPNEASKRVLTKAGFVKEGTRRLVAVKDGKQISEDVFGLIRTDIEV